MATIRIVGEIVNTQQVNRYEQSDIDLIPSQIISEDFGGPDDYIEFIISDVAGNLLNLDYNYTNFKSPNTSFVDPDGTLSVIEIDPVTDLQNFGYSSGEFLLQYNFFTNKISSPSAELFLKEISADRTEIRVGSTVLSNEDIENAVNSIINESTGSAYVIDYLINFGGNVQEITTNIALNRNSDGYEILFKLYQPLPEDIVEKSSLWVVKEKVNPYTFSINLDKLIIPDPGPKLRGPNFSIEVPNQNNVSSPYQNYTNLISSLQNVSSSYQQLLSLITSQSIDINTDYSTFNNFTFFSSANQRVANFYNKVKQIETHNNDIIYYSSLTSSRPGLTLEINNITSSVNNIISNFDGFEYYLYFESGSTLTSSVDFGVTPYPKSNSTKPFILQSTSSVNVVSWLNFTLNNATEYDDYNQNYLKYTLPEFIIDDDSNSPYVTFINMVGHYFDNIWIYLDAITDINLANNNLEKGVSKDLVYDILQSLGTKLYNKYGNTDNDIFLVGQDSGSAEFDNNFTPTGSFLNNIPRKDLLAETYKRIYHNLPLLLKTKGTTYGLQTLISTFGITSSILNIKEYGGNLKNKTLNEFNNSKVRIVNNSIVTGSVLSPVISVQTYPSSSTEFRTNDSHYVDISFSPESQIDTYASTSISTVNPTWSIDNYIGDPGYLYSSSYISLDTQRNTFYNFTASYMDYAGFIRLIQFFDNSLFKMIKDFVPARANLSTGITISSPLLERNKFPYANPSVSSKISMSEGTIDGPTISSEYTNLYTYLTGSKLAYYDGSITGSNVDYKNQWLEYNFNPYLFPTGSITGFTLDVFNRSTFNVLLNNISSSVLSATRRLLQPIYTGSGLNLTIVGYSSSYFAELQDSYESLTSYLTSRYDGSKISSLYYNTYTSASASYPGDSSYGKTATIDKQVRQIGLFTEIVSSSFLPKRNRVALKYLVDEFGGLTELNQRNKHWADVQRTFIAGDVFNISLFDNQKFGNQKVTDGNKLIFDSGYSYYPILYFRSCSFDPVIYFENLGGPSSYRVTAKNSLPLGITGSATIGHPLSASTVPTIFDNETEDISKIFSPGSTNNFPSYSVQETGNHTIQASFDIAMTLQNGHNATWSLQIFKNSDPTPLFETTQIFSDTSPTSAFRVIFGRGATESGPCTYTDPGAAWSDKDPNLTYFTTGDTLYTNSNLTTPISYTGYVAQYIPGTPSPTFIGPVYEITAGIVGNPAPNQC